MSTTSNCTKTSADSSWGFAQVHKEISIKLINNNENMDTESVFTSQNSCDGQIAQGSTHTSTV